MMILCLLLLGVLFLGGSKLSSGGYFWPILIGVFVTAHIWMMFKGHVGHRDDDAKDKVGLPAQASVASVKQPETKDDDDKHKHGGCCH